ncbi:hypothetical protein DPEC_G00012670 [Dallia pectoralis]|uniref:Uncharacterized protein n=1 Tax=Dallia pectoralis TaxID=75939 RepID=A0ACC2HLP3_DALPE|nr:hypothetical protein DPEC_G00012670 [Dallia pectoralis]
MFTKPHRFWSGFFALFEARSEQGLVCTCGCARAQTGSRWRARPRLSTNLPHRISENLVRMVTPYQSEPRTGPVAQLELQPFRSSDTLQ